MKILLPCLSLLTLLSAGTAHGQAARFGATPAEYRAASVKLALLEGDFAGLSRRYGVPMPTLRAIARGQAQAAPGFGSGKLRETITKMAKDAAGLRQEMATLRAKVSTLEATARGDGLHSLQAIASQFTLASSMLDAGNLTGAAAALERIKDNRTIIKSVGASLWTDVVLAEAKLKYLSGDIHGFDETLKSAKTELVDSAIGLAWKLEQERGERVTEFAEERQDVAQILYGAKILVSDAWPLANQLSEVEQLKTTSVICRAVLSFSSETLTSDQGANQFIIEMNRRFNVCALAAFLADRNVGAPTFIRAQANVFYANALGFISVFGITEKARPEALKRINQALWLVKTGHSKLEVAAINIAAGDAIGELYLQREDRKEMLQSIQFYNQALLLLDKTTSPSNWAAAHQRIGGCYQVLFDKSGKREDLLTAISHFEETATVFTKSFSDIAWARTMANLASVRGHRGMADRDRSVVMTSVSELKSAESLLADSMSQGVRQTAVRERGALETWLARN